MKEVKISSDFAGGNIRVVSAEDGDVTLEQELRDTAGWWFYWRFRADASAACDVTFRFANGEVVGPRGPAYSADGVDWAWLGADAAASRDSFVYSFEAGERAYFGFCLPYQVHHFERFYARIAANPAVRREVLVLTERLRPVPLLVVGDRSAERHVLLTCRHHACESVSGYVAEGLLDYVLQRTELLRRYSIHYVPFVDLDGVENGDQGKGRTPHDHNRDYVDRPIYRSTAAIIHYAKALRLEAGIDFHSPYKWGGRNDVPFLVKRASPMKEENERFAACLEHATKRRTAPNRIAYDAANDIAMGEDWNQPNERTCSSFFERSGARLACSFELPYFGTGDAVVTPDSCRRFGADFAAALETYLLGEEQA